MKKYKFVLFFFFFVIILLGLNTAPANAFAPGCNSTAGFSITTGKHCSDSGNINISLTCAITGLLRIGSAGDEVACLQKFLGISSDGKFGPKTKIAVKTFQANAGLNADGVVGPKSIKALRVSDSNITITGSSLLPNTKAGTRCEVGTKCELTPRAVDGLDDSVLNNTINLMGTPKVDGCYGASAFSVTTGEPCGITNKTPVISYISPSSAKVGDTVNVYGSGFASNSTIFYNSRSSSENGSWKQIWSVTFISPAQLKFIVPNIGVGAYSIKVNTQDLESHIDSWSNAVNLNVDLMGTPKVDGCYGASAFSVTTGKPCGITNKTSFETGFFILLNAGGAIDDLSKMDWSRHTGLTWERTATNVPGGQNYNWELLDRYVNKAQELGYNLVFVLKTGNHKTFSDPKCYEVARNLKGDKHLASCPLKPEYEDEWQEHIKSIVERYDGDGNNDMPGLKSNFKLVIQIENEASNPNLWYISEKDRLKAAKAYVHLLEISYKAVKEANKNTEVITPGIQGPNEIAKCAKGFKCTDYNKESLDFYQEVFKHPEIFDAVDIHFFNYFKFEPTFIEEGYNWVREQIGDSKPIYSFEWNGAMMLPVSKLYQAEFMEYFPYSDDFANKKDFSKMYQNLDAPENKKYRTWFETEQAIEFPKLFTTMLVSGVSRMIYARFYDQTRVMGEWDNVWWNWQGLVKYEGSKENPILIKKPSYYTYNMLVEKIDGYDSAEELTDGSGNYGQNNGSNIFVYKFSFNGKDFNNKEPIIIAWTEETFAGIVSLDLSSYFSTPTVKVTRIVTELDTNNTPIYPAIEIMKTNNIRINEAPVFIEVAK